MFCPDRVFRCCAPIKGVPRNQIPCGARPSQHAIPGAAPRATDMSLNLDRVIDYRLPILRLLILIITETHGPASLLHDTTDYRLPITLTPYSSLSLSLSLSHSHCPALHLSRHIINERTNGPDGNSNFVVGNKGELMRRYDARSGHDK